jgi:hypothetical protein
LLIGAGNEAALATLEDSDSLQRHVGNVLHPHADESDREVAGVLAWHVQLPRASAYQSLFSVSTSVRNSVL